MHESLNRHIQKNLEFVLCTNLTLIDESILKFLKNHRVMISTSLDGPKELHDVHRVSRNGESGYDLFKEETGVGSKLCWARQMFCTFNGNQKQH